MGERNKMIEFTKEEESIKALNWRWKKLNEVPEHPEEPRGIIEIINASLFGNQSWEQKALCRVFFKEEKILREVFEWKNKE